MNTTNYKDLKAEQKTAQWLKANGVSEQLFEKADIWLLQAHIAATNILKHNIEQLTDKERDLLMNYCTAMLNSKQRNSITKRTTYLVLNISKRINRYIFKQHRKLKNKQL